MMCDIAKERDDLEHASMSQGWIQSLRSRSTGTGMLIFGYHFPLNNAASASVANDKAAATAVLEMHGVPCVPHRVFISPTTKYASYSSRGGTMPALSRMLAESLGASADDADTAPRGGLVLKPKCGTSGANTFRVRTQLQLEQAWLTLLATERDFVASPFLPVDDEFRLIMLDGAVRLCYRKCRAEVVGDGKRTVAELRAAYEVAHRATLRPEQGALSGDNETNRSRLAKEARRVLPSGEKLLLEWRHNLACGASADVDVDPELVERTLLPLARTCMRALGLRFASVDIVSVCQGAQRAYRVLEVNSGVMMEGFVRQHPKLRERCKDIYAAAVDAFFHDARKLSLPTPRGPGPQQAPSSVASSGEPTALHL
jgi:glutathione synthase/RimK-type ligase-like ATP-grasp enzyme